jgi:glycosyltransferase involved in cell wall biosynthesis
MKTVTMIAYWFPPEGNAAVYRPLRFLRNLPAFGWQGHVVAGGATFGRYDPALLNQVPPGTEIVRVAGGDLWQTIQSARSARIRVEPAGVDHVISADHGRGGRPWHAALRSRAVAVARTAESWWYHPDMQRSWIRPAVREALAMCARRRPTVLWATGPPWSAFVVAQKVAKRSRIPYVLDFRTSWTIVPSAMEALRPAWAQARDRRQLHGLLQDAQAVTFFYAAEAECFWRLYRSALDATRIHVIPNGFDGAVEPFTAPSADTFTIVYGGTLSDYRYDTFLEALVLFRKTHGRAIAVHFVGEQDASFLRRIDELGLTDIVSARPPVSNAELSQLQRHAHALLMLERPPTHKGHELLAGAKLFGYLKTGRPILGVLPDGEAARILRDVGVTTIADAASPGHVCSVLETLFNGWSTGRLASFVPDPQACERYSATAQTAALARALDGLPALQPFVPGAVDVVPSLRAELPSPDDRRAL